jgi:hypothetical protein
MSCTRTRTRKTQLPQRCHQRGPEALIEIFRDYGLIPDPLGEIPCISPSQAALIRSCGYTARAGLTWRCPHLPDEVVRGYRLFEHLSNAEWIVRRWGHGPGEWHPKRAEFREILPIDPLDRFDERVMELLGKAPGQRLPKSVLQRKLWRLPGRFLNHKLSRLISAGCIRRQFETFQQDQNRPRRPRRLYTTP